MLLAEDTQTKKIKRVSSTAYNAWKKSRENFGVVPVLVALKAWEGIWFVHTVFLCNLKSSGTV